MTASDLVGQAGALIGRSERHDRLDESRVRPDRLERLRQRVEAQPMGDPGPRVDPAIFDEEIFEPEFLEAT